MQAVGIRINVLAEMKKLRETAYEDRLAWVEELVQNAQRSGATEIRVHVDPETVRVEDNGCGCTDPHVLFEKSTSGWGAGVASQSPFGEGFFSTLMVADKIIVESIGFEAEFDVKRMFEENTVDCVLVKESSRRKGFRVSLLDLRQGYDVWETKWRFRKVMKHLPVRCYINGEPVKHVRIEDTEGRKWARKVKSDSYEGWIAPYIYGDNSEYAEEGVDVYSQYRAVETLYLNGVRARVHVKDGVLTLRSPDRRAVIWDEKRRKFLAAMQKEAKAMFLALIENADDDTIDHYADRIDYYLTVKEYEDKLRFVVVGDPGFDVVLDEVGKDEEEQEQVSIEVAAEYTPKPAEAPPLRILITDPDPDQGLKAEDLAKPKRDGRALPEKASFYVEKSNIEEYKEKVAMAHYHGLTVVVARNKLEVNVLDYRGFRHISQLEKCVKLSAALDNVGACNDEERRALWVLGSLCKAVWRKENLFEIGDVTVFRETSLGEDAVIDREIVETLAIAYQGKIYIDRGKLKTTALRASASPRIEATDKQFICENIVVIAHELSHVLYGFTDGTVEHAEAQIEIIGQIMSALY